MTNTSDPIKQDLLTQELTQDGVLRLTMNDTERRKEHSHNTQRITQC